MALAIDLIQVVGGRGQADVQFIVTLIGQRHHGVDGQTTQLGQQHARQRHAIVHLGQVHVGLVEFHVNRQLVSQGSDTLVDHRLDVIVKFLHQTDVTAREFLLSAQRDDLPIGGIHVIDDVLDLTVEHFLSQLLGQLGDLVHRGDLTAHVDGLGHCQGTTHQVVDVIGHSALGQQGHSGGHILAIDLDGIARRGVNQQVVIILARLGVE